MVTFLVIGSHVPKNWDSSVSKRASLIVQLVKSLPAMQDTLGCFLDWEDLLEKGKATHATILGFLLWLSW